VLNSFRLSTGCCLLLAGSIADIVGHRIVNLCGTLVLGVFILASGLARTGLQLILFRTIQGIGVSMCLPTSVGILMTSVPSGKTRNIGFSCMGLGTPFGFSVGLILGGVFEITAVGWRLGFYVSSGATLLLFAMNCICLPKDSPRSARLGRRLATEIDWIGLLISSISLGIFSYIFA
jgi:MFS family permease